MSILKKMKKKWHTLNLHRIDEISKQKERESYLMGWKYLKKFLNLKQQDK